MPRKPPKERGNISYQELKRARSGSTTTSRFCSKLATHSSRGRGAGAAIAAL